MSVQVRPMQKADIAPLIPLTLAAYEAIFASFKQILGDDIYNLTIPDWQKTQTDELINAYENPAHTAWVAEVDGEVAGLITHHTHDETIAEIHFLVVDPQHQNKGIGSRLIAHAEKQLKDAGIKVVFLGTGGDPAHAPARHTYERSGFIQLPAAQYYKKLD